MIRFYVEQDKNAVFPVSYLPYMKRVIRRCVEEKYPNHRFEVELRFCTDREIRKVNRAYRNIDRPTDVLSFPMLDFDMPGVYVSLGTIIISTETAKRQAEEYGHSLKREFCFLCAHAALHLLGYDHENDEERALMEDKQREILNSLGITR